MLLLVLLTETEIGDPNMSINVKQDVLWLHVPVDNVVVMHVLQSQQNLAEIKASGIFIKRGVHVDVEEQLPTRTQINY